jgi:hypothetical protein
MNHNTASASRPLSAVELLSVFSREKPGKLQLAEAMTHLAEENSRLKESLKEYRRRYHLQILGAQNGRGKTDLDWINNARLAGAHLALTTRGDSYAEAAAKLIEWRPAITKLLKENRGAVSFTDKQRIIQLRKNFQSNRATTNEAGCLAYRYARKVINRDKRDPDALEELALWLILTIELGYRS